MPQPEHHPESHWQSGRDDVTMIVVADQVEPRVRPITIFTPCFADEDNTNAQNLTVKEIVARLPEHLFRVLMICDRSPDPRIAVRKNTELFRWHTHGNALLLLVRVLTFQPDIYFYPQQGPLDKAVFLLHKAALLRSAIVTHVVMVMNSETGSGLIGRSISEGDAIFANSSYVADTVQEKFGIKAQTIFNGIDRRFFFPAPGRTKSGSDHPLNVLYAGSFQERKRVDLVVEQAARWPQAVFRLAGRGETEAPCRALVQRLACKNVIFLGHLKPRQLGDEMRRSDVFLFPSILEGHPQVLGQAAACGLPAIAMNVYRPEYVIDGESGFLVESEADFAHKVDLLFCDSDLRQSMAAAAVEHSRKFDWDQIAQQWAESFERIVRR
jgi:glycosyltransferase involved in cell wall biosynthesis